MARLPGPVCCPLSGTGSLWDRQGGRGVGGQAEVSPPGEIWVGWDLLTLGECWLRGGHLEAVQEVFSLEERWWGQGMSKGCRKHLTAPTCTLLYATGALTCTKLHLTTPPCILLSPSASPHPPTMAPHLPCQHQQSRVGVVQRDGHPAREEGC